MNTYRIHRLKEHLRRQFRYAPHVSGCAQVKPRDYEAGDSIQATSTYQAFFALRDAGTPLEVGDLLEFGDGSLRIFKFVGFEEAVWVLPEPKSDGEAAGSGPGQHSPEAGEAGSTEASDSGVKEPATA
jgi:hypothetical protein